MTLDYRGRRKDGEGLLREKDGPRKTRTVGLRWTSQKRQERDTFTQTGGGSNRKKLDPL